MAKAQEILGSWAGLNAHLQTIDKPQDAMALIQAEKCGRNRASFIKRIHARYNRLRGAQERRELL